MRAIRVNRAGGPDVLHLEEVPDPSPGVGEIVVAVRAAGVNPVDTYLRAASHGYTPQLPYTPGIEAAGTVEAVGAGVTAVSPGDRVYCAGTLSGACAERALCNASQLHPLPERVSFAQGACLGVPYATAYRALFQRARGVPGETVLVHGASGGVGLAGVQLGRAAGLVVIGTAGSDRGRELVLAQGAHHVLDHHDPDHFKHAVDLTGGRGVDVILEMLANVNLGNDLPALAPGGRIVVIGSRGSVEVNPRDTMARDSSILGMALKNVPPPDLEIIHAALLAGLQQGTIRPVVGATFSLEDTAKAHVAVMASPAYGNIVLEV